jgi:hypothetical protein
MSQRIAKYTAEGFISEVEAQKLLNLLCTKYGFCLPPQWHARLVRNPPRSIDKYVDTVFHAEGLDPVTADKGLYTSIRDEACLAFERSAESQGTHDSTGGGSDGIQGKSKRQT